MIHVLSCDLKNHLPPGEEHLLEPHDDLICIPATLLLNLLITLTEKIQKKTITASRLATETSL